MPPFRPIKRSDLIYNLKAAGFSGPFPGGKHQYMVKGSLRVRIPNPHKQDISKHLLAEILKQVGISRDEWEGL